jgi:hypothetical protein
MRYPQLVIFEGDGRLAALLRPAAEAGAWALREPRQAGACLRLLGRGDPAVLMLRIGRDLERELTLLERATRLHPEAACVVVAEGDHARLAGLAWDLGAAFVVTPPVPRDVLPDLVGALLRPAERAP